MTESANKFCTYFHNILSNKNKILASNSIKKCTNFTNASNKLANFTLVIFPHIFHPRRAKKRKKEKKRKETSNNKNPPSQPAFPRNLPDSPKKGTQLPLGRPPARHESRPARAAGSHLARGQLTPR